MSQTWKCNIENWDIVDEGKVDFILDEAKLYLKSLFDGFEKLDQKSFIFLGVLFAVISGLTSFFLSKYSFDSSAQNWKLLLPALAIVLTCFVSCIFFIKCILPKPVYSLGNETKNLLMQHVCQEETRLIKIGEVLDYQIRIDECKRHLKGKSRDMKLGLVTAFLSPLMGGITLLFI